MVGQGYVGLPLALRAVQVGYDVIGYEVDRRRVELLDSRSSYVEDVSDTALEEAFATGRYAVSDSDSSLAGFDWAVVTVPTPLRDGVPDLSFIEAAAAILGPHLRPGAGVVLESTTYPGTTEELVRPILESASGLVAGRDFHLGYSPERIDPGNTKWTLANTPKVVSAVSPESLAAVADFYASLVEVVVPVSDTRVAELAKLMENTFRHVNVALVNEMAMFAEELGIDIWEAVQAAGTKPFGFMSFSPGPGVGGHCLPVDPSYLSWRVKKSLGKSFRFVELANDINDHMPHYVVDRVIEGLNRRRQAVAGSRIVLLGLAYKKNSSDVRESPAVAIAERLAGLGAVVQAVDPHVGVERPVGLEMVSLTAELLGSADAVVLVTDHDAFDYDLIARSGHYVLDTRHRLPAGPGVEFL